MTTTKIHCPHCGKVAAVLTTAAVDQCEAADQKQARLAYTIPQAAAALNLPETQVRRAVKLGDIKAIRFAGVRRIPQAELDRIRAELIVPEEGHR